MKRMMIGCLGGAPTKSLTNKVSNGDMSNGTTGWTHYTDYSTESVVSGELKSIKNTNRPYPATASSWNITTGHKLYVAYKLYGSKSGTVVARTYGTLGTTTSGEVTKSVTTTPTRFSDVITTATYTTNGLLFNASGFTTSGDYILLDNVVVIDLTAEFGAGNEPSAATMDAALAYLPGSWFDGTQNIIWTA